MNMARVPHRSCLARNFFAGRLLTVSKPESETMEDVSAFKQCGDIEHVETRPDTYVGSKEQARLTVWAHSKEKGCIERGPRELVPAMAKIFDEVLTNAMDAARADPKSAAVEVVIDQEKGAIEVVNTGDGMPVVYCSDGSMPVPQLVFGNLRAGSNFDDTKARAARPPGPARLP